MMRLEQWSTRLAEVIESARERPFDWRAHNCATFAADCVHAMTGQRLHEAFAARMTSARAARRAMRDLESLTDAVLGVDRRVPIAFARRGDVVLVPTPDAAALAICLGTAAAAVGPAGLVFVPRAGALSAWSV